MIADIYPNLGLSISQQRVYEFLSRNFFFHDLSKNYFSIFLKKQLIFHLYLKKVTFQAIF